MRIAEPIRSLFLLTCGPNQRVLRIGNQVFRLRQSQLPVDDVGALSERGHPGIMEVVRKQSSLRSSLEAKVYTSAAGPLLVRCWSNEGK